MIQQNNLDVRFFNKHPNLLKSFIPVVMAATFIVGGFSVPHAHADDSAVLGVTQISAVQTFAQADGFYPDGWKWVFNVTVPNNQTLLKMKFADWTNGSGIIPAGGNIQFYSASSLNAPNEASAIGINASSTWSGIMVLDPNDDLDVSQGGRQIQITVEARVPVDSAGGSYSTSYGINTTATSSITIGSTTLTYNGMPQPVSITTDPANLATTVTYTGTNYISTTTPPTHVGTYTVNAVITDPDYTGTSTATSTISTESIAVVAYPRTKVYDGATSTDPALTYTVTPPIYSGDSFTGALARDPAEDIGCYAITQGNLALDGDYLLEFSPSTFCITQASSTVTLGNLEQTYNKTGKSVSTTTNPVGLSTSVTYDGLATLPINAGTYTVVATITDPNYTGSTTGSLIIKPASLTVTATTSTKVYDASTSSNGLPVITSGTIFVGDTAPTWTQTFDTKDFGTGKTLTATGTVIDGNNGNNYDVTFVPNTTGSITPATAVVSATGITKIYDGTTAASTTLKVMGNVGGDTLIATDTATFVSKDVAHNIEVDVTGITISGAPAGDYTYNTTASTTADITPAPLTITANDASKIYGTTTIFAGTEFTTIPSSLYDGDSVSSVTLTSDGAASTSAVVNQPYNIIPSDATGTGLGNYSITYDPAGTLTVNQTPITVTADPQTKVYDNNPSTDPALTYKITSGSLFNGDTFPGSFTGSLTRDAGENVGVYSINQGSLALNNNYDLTFATSTFTITATTSSVSLDNLSQTYGSTTAVTVTTVPAGLATSVTYNGSATVPTDTGTYAVVATITAPNYTGSTTGNLVISPAPLTVSAVSDSKVYDGTVTSTGTPIIILGALVNGDNAVWTQTFDTKNVGTRKTLTATGTISGGKNGNNYDVTFIATTTGVIIAKDLTITAAGVKKMYDGTASTSVTLSDNRIAGDILTDSYASAVFTDQNVGTNPVNVLGITIGGTDAGNYNPNTTASTTADITPAPLTITANNITKTYGDIVVLGATTTGFTTNPSSLYDGDHVASVILTSPGAVSTALVSGSPYAIIASTTTGTGLGNYTISYADGNLAVDKKALIGTITAENKVYNGTANATITGCYLRGGVNSDDVSCDNGVFTSGEFSTRNVGTSTVSANVELAGVSAGNYTISPTATTTAAITPLAITVTAQPNTKMYDDTVTAAAPPIVSPEPVSGDTPSFVEAYSSPEVGTGLTLTPSGIVVDDNSGKNYAYTFMTDTTGVITPASQTVTINPGSIPTGPISGNTFTLTATDGSSSNPVTYSGSTPDVCNVNTTGNVTIVGIGSCSVTADQLGTNDYSAAAPDTITFTVQYSFSQPDGITSNLSSHTAEDSMAGIVSDPASNIGNDSTYTITP